MLIKYLGHSSFLIEGKEKSVVTDPFDGIGYAVKRVEADYCTVSHEHFDHNFVNGVNAKRIIRDSEDGFTAIEVFHDTDFGKKRGKTRIIKFDVDGVTFCHLGDVGENFSERLKERIGKTDVLFVPVGGNYTIDAKEAKKYIEGINPKIAIPMHYKFGKSELDIDGIEKFTAQYRDVVYKSGETEIFKDTLPKTTEIVVMGW